MKKVLLGLSVLFLMSGCDSANQTLSCSSTTTANGVTTRTKYDIDYQDDDIKHVTITYDYTQDTNTLNSNTTTDNTNAGNNNANARNNNTNNNNDMDGVNADTDGLNDDNTTDNDAGSLNADDVIDGVVGDAIDGAIGGVTDTILDIAGIKNTYENQMSSYDNIAGFSYEVDIDNDNEYKVIYEIDMAKISDSDLTRFNLGRDFSDIRDNYEGQGYTCE